jgi:hypothetical protein
MIENIYSVTNILLSVLCYLMTIVTTKGKDIRINVSPVVWMNDSQTYLDQMHGNFSELTMLEI